MDSRKSESDEQAYPLPTRIRDLPTDLRPREEMKRRGAENMDTAKLLAIVLRSGLPGQNVTELARTLIAAAGGIESLATMTYLEILGLKIHGIGPVKAMELAAAFEIGKRAAHVGASDVPVCLSSPEAVYNRLEPEARGLRQEKFFVCLLDTKNNLVGQPFCVATGANDHCPARPADIFSPAVRNGCSSVILAHNHPSGDPTPSPEDVRVTMRLVESAELLGMRVLDHVVLGRPSSTRPGFVSLRRAGLVTFSR